MSFTYSFDAAPEPRRARIVFVSPEGGVLGCLPPVPVAKPWWQEIEPVVSAVRAQHGIEIVVLRLLEAESDRPDGGLVTYLAEASEPVATQPWRGTLNEHALRLPYARPGGPQADLDWAQAVLAEKGIELDGAPVQIRTWNLSSIWKLPTDSGLVWLKSVPPFFAHEGRILAACASMPVPQLIGADGGRILLTHIEGKDQHEPALEQRLAMVDLLTDIQDYWQNRAAELLSLGLPDWRGTALTMAIANVCAKTKDQLAPADNDELDKFVKDLPRRFEECYACGIGDTLVHGDFHPGNVRGNGEALTLLDWGDCGLGHPLLDQPAFLERAPVSQWPKIRERWNDRMQEAWLGSNPEAAAKLLAPVAAARQAVIYLNFMDNIEPSEHIYHRHDPAKWLRRTADILRHEAIEAR